MLAYHPYLPVLILILTVMTLAAGMLGLSAGLGPKRRGPIKDSTYEAGMPTIGDARRRFHVRFYVVAMTFLLFDVEIVLLWPWALLLHDAAVGPAEQTTAVQAAVGMDKATLFASAAVFFAILVVGYVYDWGKGVFRWFS